MMIFFQAGAVVVERVDSGRGHETGLSHAAAHHLPDSSRFPDGRRCPRQEGAHGSTETFGKTERNGVKQGRDVPRWLGGFRQSIEQPCPVEVELELMIDGNFHGA